MAIGVLFQWLLHWTLLEITSFAVVKIFDANVAIIGNFVLNPKHSIVQ